MTDQNIIRKIGALLARADEARNDNENEREIAMRQANALMAKHDLTVASLTKEQQEQKQGPLYESSDEIGRNIWKAGVYHEIAKLHQCQAIKGQGGAVHILGRKTRVEVARSIADWCIQSIEREKPKAWDAVEGKAGINRRSFNTSFGNGAWMGIRDSVQRILAERRRGQLDGETLSRENAMVLVDQDKKALAETDDYVRRLYPRLGRGRSTSSRSSQGHAAGRAYGSGLSLNGQIGRRSAGLLN